MANTIKLKRASGSDPGASDLSVGELAIRTSNCKLFSKNDGGSAVGIVAGSADTLTTARTIAGVSFDGSGNISLNNNAITNGAGYIADLVSDTSPQLGGDLDVQSSKITTATSNGNVKIEPNGTGVVEVRGAGGNDGKLQLNCSAQSHGIKLASPAHSAGQSYTLIFPDNQIAADKYLKIKSISGSGSTAIGQAEYASLDANDLGEGTIPDARFPSTLPALNGSALTNLNGSNIASGTIAAARVATLNQDTTGNAATATALETARTIAGVSFDGTANISLNNNAITNGAGYITATLTNEEVQDIVGGMLTGNTETGITVTYQDGDGTIDFVVGTLNQDTTGNAATATALETARTIGGTSFDGTANITPAQCTNADTVDSLHASSFLRSDAADTMSQSTSGTATLTVTNSGGAGSGIGTGAIVAEFNGDSDGVVIRNIGGGDYSIMNDQQNNGLVFYDGTGGVDIIYNGSTSVEFDSGNVYGDFKGTPSVNGTNLALITDVGGGATGGGSDEVFYENDQTVTTNYTITNGKNAMAAGPISINSGVTVTVGSGETLTIV